MAAVALIFLLKEKQQPQSTLGKGTFFSFFKYWKIATPEYKKLVVGLLLFALINSSDVFLLLKAKEVTGNDSITIAAYIFYNIVYAAASYPLGMLADKWGLKNVFIAGLALFAVVYFMFGMAPTSLIIFIAFFIYGIYAAATESIAKAWITNTAHNNNTATAIGFYTSCQSLCTLLASAFAGYLWSAYSSTTTFFTSALAAVFIAVYFLFIRNKALQ